MYMIFGRRSGPFGARSGVGLSAASAIEAIALTNKLEREDFATIVFDEGGREHSPLELRMRAFIEATPSA